MGDTMTNDAMDAAAVIPLAAKLDLRASEELAETLRGRRGSDVALDAGEVEHLGAHAVQTLLVAADTWTRDGRELSCVNLTETALAQLATLGVESAALSTGRNA